MRNSIFLKIILPLFLLLFAAGILGYIKFWPSLKPALGPSPADIEEFIPKEGELIPTPPKNYTEFPLKLLPGFSISIFAKTLPGARVIKRDQFGNFLVSQTGEGIISFLEVRDGKVAAQYSILKNLRLPHGLAFDPEFPGMLYFAEENKISRVATYSDGKTEKLIDLPAGEGHFTRTIAFGPDNRLYVSIGSSCNVCNETDQRRAKIFSMEKDGSDFREHARGLRNSVLFSLSYVVGRMCATDIGRDWLGDNTPPDEINIIEEGNPEADAAHRNGARNYGWPICYGKNIHDTEFDKNTYIRNPCMEPFETPSYIDLQAHSAPLGLAFVPEEGWPEEYWYDLIVALHGSWNRSEPTGYKLVRIKLDAKGNYEGMENFISGWLTKDRALGRPVDILIEPGGIMYVSDDKAGVIYKITYRRELEDKSGLIKVKSPSAGSIIKSPVLIEGEARGFWFFEASFPISVVDARGKELGIGIAQAKDEWMTENFVSFRAEIDFSLPETDTGFLILKKDNPSGLSEHDDELLIPIKFR